MTKQNLLMIDYRHFDESISIAWDLQNPHSAGVRKYPLRLPDVLINLHLKDTNTAFMGNTISIGSNAN